MGKTLWMSVRGSYQGATTQPYPPPPLPHTNIHTHIHTMPWLLCMGSRLICTHTLVHVHTHPYSHMHSLINRTDNEGKITMKLRCTKLLSTTPPYELINVQTFIHNTCKPSHNLVHLACKHQSLICCHTYTQCEHQPFMLTNPQPHQLHNTKF